MAHGAPDYTSYFIPPGLDAFGIPQGLFYWTGSFTIGAGTNSGFVNIYTVPTGRRIVIDHIHFSVDDNRFIHRYYMIRYDGVTNYTYQFGYLRLKEDVIIKTGFPHDAGEVLRIVIYNDDPYATHYFTASIHGYELG